MVTIALVGPAIVAFAVSLAVTMGVERYAPSLGLMDQPNARSSHVTPRPRGGGMGIVCGIGAAGATSLMLGRPLGFGAVSVYVAACVVAATGLWDDIRPLGVSVRLAAQTAVAIGLVAALGGMQKLPLPAPLDVSLSWIGAPLTVLWIVGVTNFFNFMDGADGLAGGQACLTFLTIAWVLGPSSHAAAAGFAAAATLAFLARNWSPARVFLGDVGSAFLGFLLAACPLMTPVGERERLTLLIFTSLSLCLLDPVATLALRLARGRTIGVPHRDHAYQQLFDPGAPQAVAVGSLLVVAALLSVAAAAAYVHASFAWWSLAGAVVAFAVEWIVARRRSAARGTPRDGRD